MARDDTALVGARASALIDILANDSDAEGAVTLANLPAASDLGVALSLDPATGRVLYDPRGLSAAVALPAGATLADGFAYTVRDSFGQEATARVSITLSGANDAPVANADAAATDEDTATAIAVLANDTDPDTGTVLSVASVQATSLRGAAVTVLADGRVRYDPTVSAFLQQLGAGQSAEDRFAYTVADGAGGAAEATVTVTVGGRNHLPVLLSARTGEDAAVVVSVPGGAATAALNGVRGGRATVVGGQLRYDPTPSAALQALQPGGAASDAVRFAGVTALGEAFAGTLAVVVEGANDAPRAAALAADTGADAVLFLDPLPRATDRDAGAVLSLGALPAMTSALGAAVSVEPGGRLRYDPTASATLRALVLDELVEDRFGYTVADEHGAVSTATATVRVAGKAPPPPIALPPREVSEDAALLFAPGVAGMTLVSVNPLTAQGFAASLRSGQVSFDPTRIAALQALRDGESLADTITLTLRDAMGRLRQGQVAVTVLGANDAPVAANDRATAWDNAAAAFNVRVNDRDADAGETLAVGLPLGRSDLGAALSVDADGRVVYDPTGNAALRNLATGASVADRFSYTLTDAAGASSTAFVDVTVTGRNDAPLAVADSAETDEGTAITIAVLANDVDRDGPTLSVSLTHATSHLGARLARNGDGSVFFDPRGVPRFEELAEGEALEDRFFYTVSDGAGGRATAVVLVRVVGRNGAPAARDDAAATNEDAPINIRVLSNDRDPDRGTVLAVSLPAGATSALGAALSVNADGTVRYDPRGVLDMLALGETAEDSFSYTVSDGRGGTATATARVSVAGRNDRPVAAPDALAGFSRDAVRFSVLANDRDPDRGAPPALLFVGARSRLGATVAANADGTVRWDPAGSPALSRLADGATLTDSFTYVIVDSAGARSIGAATVTVTGGRAPIAPAAAPLVDLSAAASLLREAPPPPPPGRRAAPRPPAWQVGFVADGAAGAAPADPNTGLLITLPSAAA